MILKDIMNIIAIILFSTPQGHILKNMRIAHVTTIEKGQYDTDLKQ